MIKIIILLCWLVNFIKSSLSYLKYPFVVSYQTVDLGNYESRRFKGTVNFKARNLQRSAITRRKHIIKALLHVHSYSNSLITRILKIKLHFFSKIHSDMIILSTFFLCCGKLVYLFNNFLSVRPPKMFE